MIALCSWCRCIGTVWPWVSSLCTHYAKASLRPVSQAREWDGNSHQWGASERNCRTSTGCVSQETSQDVWLSDTWRGGRWRDVWDRIAGFGRKRRACVCMYVCALTMWRYRYIDAHVSWSWAMCKSPAELYTEHLLNRIGHSAAL